MRNFLNPKWLLLVNTLPLGILFFLLLGQYEVIKSLLDKESLYVWTSLGLGLAILGILNLFYTGFAILKAKNVSIIYALLALIAYITYLYLYSYHLNKIIPISIPQWMVSDNFVLYAGTFLMPTLIYALFVIVAHFTPSNKEHKAGVNFLIAAGIPITGYLFTQVIAPLWQPFAGHFKVHVLLILYITITLIFLFFLIRGIYIITLKNSSAWRKYQLVWKIPITLVLPIIGLLVNNGDFLNDFTLSSAGVFGDFNHYLFYLLAFVNGVVICLPNLKNKTYRIFLLITRSITLAYTLYFFFIFLPFLPFSIIAIIVFGAGFLMLTPLLLFVVHINEISKDFNYLKTFIAKNNLYVISFLSVLLIPSLITASYLKDKATLNESLEYVYSPNYSKNYNINKTSLEKTLTNIIKNKDRRGGSINFMFSGTPYLSSYFKWIVLDNLTLSDTKINTLYRIFFAEQPINDFFETETTPNDRVEISNIQTQSSYDKNQKVWRSWVNLELTNLETENLLSEYTTTFHLPTGTWVSDYYLYVNGKKEPGILAEKKAAQWIFSQILNENKDPGILYYLTGNKIAFRVFPFSKDEVRKTGIEFIHKDPIKLNIDHHLIELGEADQTLTHPVETDNLIYLSSDEKKELKTVHRKPYFHFLVDASQGKDQDSTNFIKRIEKLTKLNSELAENAKISFINSQVTTIPLTNDWKKSYHTQSFEGGYFLEHAIKKALVESYQENTPRYPVLVAVTDSIQNAVLGENFADLNFTYPENDLFYNLLNNGSLEEHSLFENSATALPETTRECMFCETVLAYPLSSDKIAYLPNNQEPSIILKKDIFEVPESEIKEKNWLSALEMQGQWQSQLLHPEISNSQWLTMVKHSFLSKIMTPYTSFLVVENEAQKAMLKKKQEQILAGNKNLDPNEEVRRMSEPSIWILLTLFLLFLAYKTKLKNKKERLS